MFGAALLAVAVGTTVKSGQAAAQDDLDNRLHTVSSLTAAELGEYFDRARSIELLLADSATFRAFEPDGAPGSHHLTGAAEVPLVLDPAAKEAAEAMAYLEELYLDRISEACLIDANGHELARVVRGIVAPPEELSHEEASASFFAPTMQLPAGRVHQALPYVSPDTGLWVISNTTPMVGASGQPWGLVHFEVALESFRPQVTDAQHNISIVDVGTGRVVLDSSRPLDPTPAEDADFGRPISAQMRTLLAADTSPDPTTIDGQRRSFAPVPTTEDNANRWVVVVSAPAVGGSWWASMGPAPVAMALAAVALLVFAALNLRASHRRLRAASLTDELTGLPNRRLLTDRLDRALAFGTRKGLTSAVLLIDLDRFKEVNDTLGHDYGDDLLRSVAARLTAAFRTSDTVARLGGDEFAVLLPEVADQPAAIEQAERCLALLREPFVVQGFNLGVDASIGVALCPHHGCAADEVMRAADVAMYEAKADRRGVLVYERSLDGHSPSRLALLGELRQALQDDQLVLYYQPKVDVTLGRVTGAEALVRWQHPERGLVPPGDFIPVAEGSGLILPLTMYTLEAAVAQAKAWLDAGQAIQVAVNLSPRCLVEPTIPDQVRQLLHRHGLPARLLRLELTESTVMADPERALGALMELRNLGVAISIDDFGTGYSSMSYLKRLPVDELKIDRSFVMDMLAEGHDAVLVRSSIDLGHNLGLAVVAEGVEDEETLTALRALGCDVVQGYHLARPMPASAFTDWVVSRVPIAVAGSVTVEGAPPAR
ncbi:diguanylate cyclase (GGDEF) domain-containing protein [Geodermatophilus pulveris]|uniref:Diguanylate cyclase (GGDEF) domain-containing protein n=1 Tax=Geodermatophilus pulveris TaxID=1564159 RepID=A0A239JKI5_9ACTN|nr:diguanylate cyclase (GGDEF) domain-containing protein [Geodermatophilus pulveris]